MILELITIDTTVLFYKAAYGTLRLPQRSSTFIKVVG